MYIVLSTIPSSSIFCLKTNRAMDDLLLLIDLVCRLRIEPQAFLTCFQSKNYLH
jgi:hypothetical protein